MSQEAAFQATLPNQKIVDCQCHEVNWFDAKRGSSCNEQIPSTFLTKKKEVQVLPPFVRM
jgi:hypothetical protein